MVRRAAPEAFNHLPEPKGTRGCTIDPYIAARSQIRPPKSKGAPDLSNLHNPQGVQVGFRNICSDKNHKQVTKSEWNCRNLQRKWGKTPQYRAVVLRVEKKRDAAAVAHVHVTARESARIFDRAKVFLCFLSARLQSSHYVNMPS